MVRDRWSVTGETWVRAGPEVGNASRTSSGELPDRWRSSRRCQVGEQLLVASGGASVRLADGAVLRVPRAQLPAVLRRAAVGSRSGDTDGRVRLLGLVGGAQSVGHGRLAAVRGLFEFAVITGARDNCPVPVARRSSGARAKRRGLLGHVSSGRPRTGGHLVREPRRLPESLDCEDPAVEISPALGGSWLSLARVA